MKNVKDQVYAALCTVSENVSDAYPRSWAEGSTIQYTEEQNDVYLSIINIYEPTRQY